MAKLHDLDINKAEQILLDQGAIKDEIVALQDITVHKNRETGDWVPEGFSNLENFADMTTIPGKAIIRKGTRLLKSDIPPDIWESWLRKERIAERYKVTAIVTKKELKNVIRLLRTNHATEIYELVNHGGFNAGKQHNDVGVQVEEVSAMSKPVKPLAKVEERKPGRPSKAVKSAERASRFGV